MTLMERMSMSNFDITRLSLDELAESFRSLEREGANTVVHRCRILVEYERRGEGHPKMGRGLFKYFREVAAGTLSASLLEVIGGDAKMVEKMNLLPIAEQERLAAGDDFEHAEFDPATGNIVVRQTPITRIMPKVLDVAIGEKGYVPIEKQKKIVRSLVSEKAIAKVRKEQERVAPLKPSLAIDRKTFQLVVNGTIRIDIAEVFNVFKTAGWIFGRATAMRLTDAGKKALSKSEARINA